MYWIIIYTNMKWNQHRLHIEYANTKTLQDSFLMRRPHCWNSLPLHLTEFLTKDSFANRLKHELLASYWQNSEFSLLGSNGPNVLKKKMYCSICKFLLTSCKLCIYCRASSPPTTAKSSPNTVALWQALWFNVLANVRIFSENICIDKNVQQVNLWHHGQTSCKWMDSVPKLVIWPLNHEKGHLCQSWRYHIPLRISIRHLWVPRGTHHSPLFCGGGGEG